MGRVAQAKLLSIDDQNCFMGEEDGSPLSHLVRNRRMGDVIGRYEASLPVAGSVQNARRLAGMVDRLGTRLVSIHATLDTHQVIHVAHPAMWSDRAGKEPGPFTVISVSDIERRLWFPRNPTYEVRLLSYVRELERKGNYPLMIWPEHGILGTWGHTLYHELSNAFGRWQVKTQEMMGFTLKGMDPFSEMYSALEAEVPNENPATQLNRPFIEMLECGDEPWAIGGEALSHCVRATVRDIAKHVGKRHLSKFHLLTDCMSPVRQVGDGPDFPKIGRDFLLEMQSLGMTLTTSQAFFA